MTTSKGQIRRWMLLSIFVLVGWISHSYRVDAAGSSTKYDLYSWKDQNDWYYSLVPTTSKAADPVEVRWSPGRVRGVYKLKEQILQLPKGSHVDWRLIEDHHLVIPPGKIVSDVTQYAASMGVDVVIKNNGTEPLPYEK